MGKRTTGDARDAVPAAELSDLSERERRFVNAYAGEAAGNGVQAADLAGYTGDRDVLATQAWRLLRKAEIRDAIEAMVESDELVAGRVERLRTLSKILRGDVPEVRYVPSGERVELPTRVSDRLAACVELGKLAGDYVTKVAQTTGAGDDVEALPLEELFVLARLGEPGA